VRLEEIWSAVPEYSELMTIEELSQSSLELVRSFSSLARTEVIGASSEGRPIERLIIGHGSRRALMVGVPHPNEPIGTLTLDFLSRHLCERSDVLEELDLTVSIIKVADPDGLSLNAGWLKGVFSPLQYALGYYRSPPSEQVEWGFPIRHKTLRFDDPPPETRALMAVIERERPSLVYNLHNASFCGVYFFASRRDPALFASIRDAARSLSLPIHRGEPEVPFIEPYEEGFYPLFGAREIYDHLERSLGEDPAGRITTGTSMHDFFASRVPDGLMLVSELPYFTDRQLEDDRPSGRTRAEALAEGLARRAAIVSAVQSYSDRIADRIKPGRIQRAVEEYLRRAPAQIAAARASLDRPELARPATNAESFDVRIARTIHPILVLGEVRRLALEINEGGIAEEIRARVEEDIAKLSAESELVMPPLRKLVTLQAHAGLHALGT
jgi:hypothetical protein